MKRLFFVILLIISTLAIFAQPKIKFENDHYDFGTFKEEGGKVSGKFIFTNIGDSALLLTNVRPGCGCTAANYTQTPVLPGEQGYIEAIYDPYNRPGRFTKNIRVTTNEPKFLSGGNAAPHFIYIQGNVLKRPPTVFELAGFNAGRGMMRFQKNNYNFSVKHTGYQVDTLRFRNFSKKSITIESVEFPPYITELQRSFRRDIHPDAEHFIIFRYEGAKRNAWGRVSDRIKFTTNDSVEAVKYVHFNVEIEEDFSILPAGAKLPKAEVSSASLDFGKVKVGEQVERVCTITNNGAADLIIRNVSTNLHSITHQMEKHIIPAGGSAKLTLYFDTAQRRGRQNGVVTVVCNDPEKSKITISMSGEILP